MDWMKLFALLVAVASTQITAEGPKKKIRIHLPQKVKHIHHHKKIYITNHAASQYAPAYLPSAEGAVAVPTNVALPAVASLVPFNSVELYDESPARMPGVAPAASKLLPLYRARGYYGPKPSEWEDQDYDLAPPPETTDSYASSAFTAPSAASAPSVNYIPKRVKVLKVNEVPRKKVVRKTKPPKRVVLRSKPQPEDEHPVSTYHEQFYSDLEGSGTIRKVRKPQRVEKIIDGDTEHIHTYSEEHIHKLFFDDGSKLTNVLGVDPVGSMSALAGAHPLLPLKGSQTLLAIPDGLTGLTAVGSMGTPSHLEYAAYNPRDVTHDHIFHDHGEIPDDIEITKNTLGLPPKVSYNSQGLRINAETPKRYKNKFSHKYVKPTKPTSYTDFSYYESIYTPNHRIKKVPRPTYSTIFDAGNTQKVEDYRHIPSFKYSQGKGAGKTRQGTSYYGNKDISDYGLQEASVPAPFSVSTTVVHDYEPKSFSGGLPSGFSKFKDPFVNFKNSYTNNFEYDTYASSSNLYPTEDKTDNHAVPFQGKKGKKKSISTTNISFGGQDHQTYVDHLEEAASSINDGLPTAIDNFGDGFEESRISETITPTPYTIRASSPVHQYYTSMAEKALHGEQLTVPEASNNNYQYAEAPTPSTPSYESSVATTLNPASHYFELQDTDTISDDSSDHNQDSRQGKRQRDKSKKSELMNVNMEPTQIFTVIQPTAKKVVSGDRPPLARTVRHRDSKIAYGQGSESGVGRGNPKYGDKL